MKRKFRILAAITSLMVFSTPLLTCQTIQADNIDQQRLPGTIVKNGDAQFNAQADTLLKKIIFLGQFL
ncbi:hypothetical protein [Companilactobacillus versmoldensis]|nr:hypothetical protein [Companilactobacillus versmoldensis]